MLKASFLRINWLYAWMVKALWALQLEGEGLRNKQRSIYNILYI